MYLEKNSLFFTNLELMSHKTEMFLFMALSVSPYLQSYFLSLALMF